MHVVLLTHEPVYPPSGGGSSQLPYLCRALVDAGHRVTLVGPPPSDPGVALPDWGGQVRFVPFRAWRMSRNASTRLLRYAAYPSALARQVAPLARRDPPDLFMAQHLFSSFAAGRLGARFGVPWVANYLDCLLGYVESWPRWTLGFLWVRLFERLELGLPARRNAAAVLTISDELADALVAHGTPRERILPTYFGVDTAVFPAPAATPSPGADGPPTVVMHGSFDHHHLGPLAREAVVQALRRRPGIRFLFVGPETAALRALQRRVREALPDAHVEATGFVPYAQVGRRIAAATIGWVPYAPSLGAHMTVVAKALEFAACGLPFVATALRGTRRYFEGAASVRFTDFTAEALAEGVLEWLARAEERRPAAAALSRRVRAEQDWTALCGRAVAFCLDRARRMREGDRV